MTQEFDGPQMYAGTIKSDFEKMFPPRTILSEISHAKDLLQEPDEYDVPDDAADYLKRKEQKDLEQQEATQKDEKNPK